MVLKYMHQVMKFRDGIEIARNGDHIVVKDKDGKWFTMNVINQFATPGLYNNPMVD